MSPPRCGLTTVVVPLSTWSPVNSSALLVEEEAQVVRRVAGRVQRLEPELGAVDRRRRRRARGRASRSNSSAFGNLPNPATSAPVFLRIRAAAGQWSGCVCVSSTQRTRSRIDAPTIASTCPSIVGTGIDHRDFVDADEIGVGAGPGHEARDSVATTRRTSGDSALGTPGVARRAATGSSCFTCDTPSAASRALGRGCRVSGSGIVHRRARRRVVAGEHDALASGIRDDDTGACSSSRGTRSSAAKNASAVAKRASASRQRIVGKIRSRSPRAYCASASAGRTQAEATSSPSSCTPSWPSGDGATKNHVS